MEGQKEKAKMRKRLSRRNQTSKQNRAFIAKLVFAVVMIGAAVNILAQTIIETFHPRLQDAVIIMVVVVVVALLLLGDKIKHALIY